MIKTFKTYSRNQIRNPIVKFRVFFQNNNECKHAFCIPLKDLTWDCFLNNLFSPYTFEENQLPTIILLNDGFKYVVHRENFGQLIRDNWHVSLKLFGVDLLIPDVESFFSSTTNANGQNAPNLDLFRRKKIEINDLIEVFSKRIEFPTMDHFVQNAPHVRFLREERNESTNAKIPTPFTFKDKLGELHLKRIDDGDLLELLKAGDTLVLQTRDDKMVSMKFHPAVPPTFNETQYKYRNQNLMYECSDLKVPVLIDNEIKFLFNQDAEFVQNIKTTAFEAALQQESIKKTETIKETSPDTEIPSTSGVTISTAPVAEVSTPPEVSINPKDVVSVKMAGVPPEQVADLSRPHRSAQKRSKRCLATAKLANAAAYSSTTSANIGGSTADNPSGGHLSCGSSRENIVKAFQDLSLSSSPPTLSDLAACYHFGLNTAQPFVKPGTSKNVAVDAQQENTSNPPAWFSAVLNEFKSEVLQDVRNLVKSVLNTSFPTPSVNEMKTLRVQNQKDDQNHYKTLDGSPSSFGGKHKHYEKHHHGSGSSKRKSGSLCSKRGGGVLGVAENKTITPYSASEKILEISNSLFVYSKSGFKVRMPRNASLTIQINIGKYAKYRNSLDDTDLRVQSISNSIECCVKRATPAYGVCSINKDLSVYYDVRIKSKEKFGKFRLYFNVISGGRIVGYSFKIDVRVKKEFTLSTGNPEVTLNYESEVFPIPMVENIIPTALSSDTKFIESQKSPAQNSQEGKSIAAAAAIAVELADEGIGGNEEDFFSPTLDSEYWDMTESKPDSLLEVEGIDTCYRSVIDTVTNAALKCEHPDFDSESDTDSSISFLMDEKEARNELNDSLDVVQLPSCFIPNIECTDNVVPVRIKRKSSMVTKHAVSEKNGNDMSPQPQDIKPSAFDTSTLTPVTVAASAPSSSTATAAKRTTPSLTPVVTISDDEEDEDVEFLNESIKSAAADHAYHRSLYPNLQGLKECIRPTTSNNVAHKAELSAASSYPESSAFTPESPKQRSSPEPYLNILPEKLFEMCKNAAPISRQMQETVSSVFTSVSNEVHNAAIAARTAAASAAAARTAAANAVAAAANIMPNAPMPSSPSTSSSRTVNPENFNNGGTTSAKSTTDSTPSIPKDENRFSHSRPRIGKRQKNVGFSFEAEPTVQQQQKSSFTFGSPKPRSEQGLTDNMAADLITLRNMGFTNEPFMIYLLEQFPNDLSKVVESLLNESMQWRTDAESNLDF